MPDWFTVYDGELYFSAYVDGSSYNIYSYNPTTDTVTQRTDISENLQPEHLTVFDDKLFFKGRLPGSGGAALLYYDAATEEVETTLQINTRGSNPSWLTVFNDKLYFSANDGIRGAEVWSLATCLNLFADVEPVYHPDSLGSIQLYIEGGAPPYTISWSHGSNTQNQEGMPPGEYTVVVSDSTGCLSEHTLEVRYIDTTSAPEVAL